MEFQKWTLYLFFCIKSVFSVNLVNLNTNFIPKMIECIYQKTDPLILIGK